MRSRNIGKTDTLWWAVIAVGVLMQLGVLIYLAMKEAPDA